VAVASCEFQLTLGSISISANSTFGVEKRNPKCGEIIMTKSLVILVGVIFLSLIYLEPASAQNQGKLVSDGLLGNEPNIIPFIDCTDDPDDPCNLGPQEYAPGTLGDKSKNSGHDNYVIPTGSPGPITCGGNWFGVRQLIDFLNGDVPDTSLPGNPDAPGMNVDCSGNEKPHVP